MLVLRSMAAVTTRCEAGPLHVLLFMAIVTTGLCVASGQRKACLAVIERRSLPFFCTMAAATAGAETAFMFIFFAMALDACRSCVFV